MTILTKVKTGVLISILAMLACSDGDLKEWYMGGPKFSEGLSPEYQLREENYDLKEYTKDLEGRLKECNYFLEVLNESVH